MSLYMEPFDPNTTQEYIDKGMTYYIAPLVTLPQSHFYCASHAIVPAVFVLQVSLRNG